MKKANKSGEFMADITPVVQFTAFTGSDYGFHTIIKLGGFSHPRRVEFEWGGEHEEGFSYTSVVFELSDEDKYVTMSRTTRSSDCDGPMAHYTDASSAVSNYANELIAFAPDEVKRRQHDAFAESMGY